MTLQNHQGYKIKIIGLGGIGSVLVEHISRFINYSNNQSEITLIDGDTYEPKNYERQSFTNIGNKANVKKFELTNQFENVTYEAIPFYLSKDSIKDIVKDNDIVFLAVDNHATRKIVSDHCSTLDNSIVISGGNEYTDGNVQIYVRKEGKNRTPSLTEYHPEIDEPDDKSPDEMSCEELSKSGSPQLLFTNLTAATLMSCAFYNVLQEKYHQDVYFDIVTMNTDSKFRTINS